MIILEIYLAQEGIAVPASRPVSGEPVSIAQTIIHSGALQSLQRGGSFRTDTTPSITACIWVKGFHALAHTQTIRANGRRPAGVGFAAVGICRSRPTVAGAKSVGGIGS